MLHRARPERDACPGALRVHEAADGGLARIRVPGGVLAPPQVRAIAAAAALGDGGAELTSRANVQVRGLPAGAEEELAAGLRAAGLLPSATHERVRNIIGSPSADGRELVNVRAVARELDAALCATPSLADLPGRFLFAVDDGSTDVISLGADVGLLAQRADTLALVLAGVDSGVRSTPDQAAGVAIAAAEAFLAEKAAQGRSAWRLAELDDGARRVADRLGAVPAAPLPSTQPATHAQVGGVQRPGGTVAVVAGAPLGRLSREQLDIITAASDAAGELRLTPWRTVVLPGLRPDEAGRWLSDLGAHGLLVDPSSAGAGVTACAGRPGCAKARADVRDDARRASRAADGSALPVHWSGCERRCGRPQGRVVEVLATGAGYEVGLDGETRASGADVDQVSAALVAARRTV
ncbi:precorrin-3B synthase [Saccharopolyspora shandongensis]|uniref:Precorrin-3B synthase n=1 Tax=Saccharopolyspora shandongensis TaxID=418495 RepID=A0A1H2WTL1_9PSEU|nr:precorrin-3B synthase [Saccharopolyspora shandongensis]SDW83858.1 precorrin-3B synthase [Saccharopolyspora shandongensis]